MIVECESIASFSFAVSDCCIMTAPPSASLTLRSKSLICFSISFILSAPAAEVCSTTAAGIGFRPLRPRATPRSPENLMHTVPCDVVVSVPFSRSPCASRRRTSLRARSTSFTATLTRR